MSEKEHDPPMGFMADGTSKITPPGQAPADVTPRIVERDEDDDEPEDEDPK